MTSPKDRRTHPRVDERLILSVADATGTIQAETKNLSATGVYCALQTFLPPMTKLQLEFELPVGQRRVRVRCEGVVVRVDPVVTTESTARYHTGIWFNELSLRDREAIASYVRQRLAKHPPTP